MSTSTGMLALVCSKTEKQISTGARYTASDLARVRDAKLMLRCKYCKKTHLFRFADALITAADD